MSAKGIALIFVLAILGSTDVRAQGGSTRVYLKLPRSGEVLVDAGRFFRNYRFPLEFRLPEKSRAAVSSRGNFPMVEIRPLESRNFLILHTTFKIRRPKFLKDFSRRVISPCPMPDFPAKEAFRVETSCKAMIGLNRLTRRIVYIRDKNLLYMFYITFPDEARAAADAITGTVRTHAGFQFRDISGR